MPAKSKKILVTTKQHEVFIVRRNPRNIIQGFCPECEKEVGLLTLDEATSTTGRRTRDLIQLVEKGLVHSLETESGHWLICLNSLKEQLEKTKT